MEDTIEILQSELKAIMEEFFEKCEDRQGVLRSVMSYLGVAQSSAIVEAVIESGLKKNAPYPVLHFHTTMAKDIDDAAVPDIIMSLNGLNHVISAGAFPSFGTFCYYGPLRQIYLSYRMPVSLRDMEGTLDNVRYYLGLLYEQLDVFMDFILFICSSPGSVSIGDYMEYLDEIKDFDDLDLRLKLIEEKFNEAYSELFSDDNGMPYNSLPPDEADHKI